MFQSERCFTLPCHARLLAAVVFLVIGFAGDLSFAAPFTLIDDNSIVTGDTSNTVDPQIVTSWSVDGVNQLYQQGFWYRVGNTGPESKVSTLPISLQGTSDTNFDTFDDTLFVRYSGAGFDIELRLAVDGGTLGSGASDMPETISVKNNQASPLNFHFFQYVDFDLQGTSSGDVARFLNSHTVEQFEAPFRLTETVVTPSPSHREINFAPLILAKLNDGVATTLSDSPGPLIPLGPGDVTWAYQWDVIIAPGSTFQISKDKNIASVPEPTALLLAALAAFGFSVTYRRISRRR